jgi:hypothetical protein
MACLKSTRRKRLPANAEGVQLPAELRTDAATMVEVNLATSLFELEEARKIALARGQAAAAVSATMAKAKMAGLLNEGAQDTTVRTDTATLSLSDAARRIAFLLRLAQDEPAGESER